MTSAVTICSNALVMLGDKPINSFTPGDGEGNIGRTTVVSNLWPTVRDSVLRAHPWNCAIKRVILSPDSTAPVFGFTSRFLLPDDWLRNVEINGTRVDDIDYTVESGYLHMNYATCKLKYVWKNTQVETWDPMLVDACELAMAARACMSITQDKTLREQLVRDFERTIRNARTVDGQDESPAQFGDFDILAHRRS